jgi:carboxyl-terminal processing protease
LLPHQANAAAAAQAGETVERRHFQGSSYISSPTRPPDATTVAEVVEIVTSSYLVEPDDQTVVQGCLGGLGADTTALPAPRQLKPTKASELAAYIDGLPGSGASGDGGRVPAHGCIEGILAALEGPDARTPQEPPEARIRQNDATAGVTLSRKSAADDGTVEVTGLISDSPADLSGIRVGDRIVAIDGAPIESWDVQRIERALRGPRGAHVTLAIRRTGHPGTLEFPLVLSQPRLPDPTVRRLDGARVLYVVVPSMQVDTPAALLGALASSIAAESGTAATGIVVDLRGNVGGLLRSAIGVAAIFLPDDVVIVETRGRTPKDTRLYQARPQDVSPRQDRSYAKNFIERPALLKSARIVVLIDSRTGSGSVAVAEALRLYRHAMLVGEPSSSVAEVRTVFPLAKDKGRLVLATGQLFAPDGRCLDGRTTAPDVVVREPDADTIGSADDPGLQKALEILRTVE